MKRIVSLLGILLTGALLFSCSPKVIQVGKATPEALPRETLAAGKSGSRPGGSPGETGGWEETLKAAQKEGKVIVYAGTIGVALKEVAPALIKDKFGFNLEVMTARGGQLATKLSTERRAGLYIPDIYISGPSTIFNVFIPQGWADKLKPLLILPEVVDSSAWYGGEHPWVDKDRSIMFVIWNTPNLQMVINTNLVKPGEMTSFQDLLDPKWRGKIIINDPTVAGTSSQSVAALIYHKVLDVPYFRELIKQNPILTRDEQLHIDWVARGKATVAMWPTEVVYNQFVRAGASLSGVTPKEGVVRSAGGGVLLVMDRAPHPNAAKIFVNWLLSKEGMYLMQGATGKRSARVDIPVDNVAPVSMVKPEIKLFMEPSLFDEEYRLRGQDKIEELVKEIFGPLLK